MAESLGTAVSQITEALAGGLSGACTKFGELIAEGARKIESTVSAEGCLGAVYQVVALAAQKLGRGDDRKGFHQPARWAVDAINTFREDPFFKALPLMTIGDIWEAAKSGLLPIGTVVIYPKPGDEGTISNGPNGPVYDGSAQLEGHACLFAGFDSEGNPLFVSDFRQNHVSVYDYQPDSALAAVFVPKGAGVDFSRFARSSVVNAEPAESSSAAVGLLEDSVEAITAFNARHQQDFGEKFLRELRQRGLLREREDEEEDNRCKYDVVSAVGGSAVDGQSPRNGPTSGYGTKTGHVAPTVSSPAVPPAPSAAVAGDRSLP